MRRLKEPSTWAGIAVFFQLIKGFVPAQYGQVADAASALGASLAAVLPERAPAK